MPYNMWFVTPAAPIPARELIEFVAELGDGQTAELTDGTPDDWRQLVVNQPDGSWSFDIEPRGYGPDDDEFFRGWLEKAEPAVNARWVADYLPRAKTVYLFRCSLSAPDSNLGLVRDIVESFQADDPGGLLYAELEGWSNESGQHITWEFSDRVTGVWTMALRAAGGWTWFEMDLGNRAHRWAFRAGEVPAGVKARTYTDD